MANARQIALAVLYEIEYEAAYSNIALKSALAASGLSSEDKAFATRLVYGTVQYKLTLDYIIEKYSKLKKNKISKYIFLILRMGVYQLEFMDKVPDSAAVNESVRLARRYGHGASAGFVNGILRSVVRGRGDYSYPDNRDEYLSVKHSCPVDMIRRWIKDFGDEFTEDLLLALNEPAPMSLRVNTLKTTVNDVLSEIDGAKTSDLCADAVICDGFDIASSELYKRGKVTVQDVSAMLASLALAPQCGETVIDMCAAPGGKTTHMAQLMRNKGKITAFDIHEHKISLIEKNAQRLGIDIIEAKQADSMKYIKKYEQSADRVLVDVPCSGLGIIRRKPDIKWKTKESGIFDIQLSILENASRYVKSGGYIVYSTCTIERDENENVIEKFLREHSEFVRTDITDVLPEKLRRDTAKHGYITLYPHIDGSDGFFICKLKKR